MNSSSSSSLRQEIGFRILKMNQKDILGNVTDDIIKIFEKRIDSKIQDIKKAREDKSLDFEGDSNLESQIEMLEEWKKEEILK